MRRQSFPRALALVFGGAFLVGACTGGGASSAPSVAASAAAASTAPASAAATVAPTVAPTEMPGTKTFSVGLTTPGLGYSPLLAALDAMRGQGYTIDTPVLANAELETQGVASGKFAFGTGAISGVMTADEAGAQLKVIVNLVKNEWTLYTSNSITTCAGLDGRKLAINSAGSVSTAMIKNYIATNCAGTVPDYLIVAGSDVRLKAFLANQIEASPLELGDGITIDAQASDRYHLLSNFSADLPNLQTTPVYVNADFAKANPGTVVDLVKAQLEQFRKIDGNADYLKQIAQKYVPDAINEATIDAAVKKYVDLKMFPVNGGLTQDNLTYTAKFFGPAPDGTGTTKKLMNVTDFADLSYLQMALDALGTK